MAAALAASAAAGSASAQSTVTLYGIVDAGITYASHARTASGGSRHLYTFGDGVASGSRWGLRGAEDLGNGLKAVFTLESGYNSGTGAAGQGGALFGRQAFVGLQKSGVGTLSVGRQYTFTTEYIGSRYSNGGNTAFGNLAYHTNDADQLTSSRVNNSVKFSSASFAGFTFGGLYGFSNTPGAFAGAPGSASRAYSFGANYENGPFGIGAAYTDIAYPGAAAPAFSTTLANVSTTGQAAGTTAAQVRDLRTFSLGSRYAVGPATIWAMWSNTRFEPLAGESTSYNAIDAGAKYALTPALTGAVSYTYSKVSDKAAHWNQFNAALDYAFSKRTDVYVLAAYQQASGQNVQAQIGDSNSILPTSGSGQSNQTAVRVGMRHRF